MTKYEEEWLRGILQADTCNQWELERLCRLTGKNARDAVRNLQPIPITKRKYKYYMIEVKQYLGL